MRRLLLASASPRRRELIVGLTHDFDVLAPDVNEAIDDAVPAADAVRLLSQRKAEAALEREPDRLILAADTLVSLGERLFGKPDGADAARDALRGLRDRWHSVSTGFCFAGPGTREQDVVTTRVLMRALSDTEIEDSIRSGAPFDKAGAYAIQDPVLRPVTRIDGCYCNVMGLPLWDVWRTLTPHGLVLRRPDETRTECRSCPRRATMPTA